MVLNNHGWGLKQMILYSAILIVALLFVIFFSFQLMDDLGDTFRDSMVGDITYSSIEESISNATLLYMDEYYENEVGTGTITVTTANLIQYGMLNDSDLITNTKDICKGYALVRKDTYNELKAEPFIQCSDYVTNNYQNWRLGE